MRFVHVKCAAWWSISTLLLTPDFKRFARKELRLPPQHDNAHFSCVGRVNKKLATTRPRQNLCNYKSQTLKKAKVRRSMLSSTALYSTRKTRARQLLVEKRAECNIGKPAKRQMKYKGMAYLMTHFIYFMAARCKQCMYQRQIISQFLGCQNLSKECKCAIKSASTSVTFLRYQYRPAGLSPLTLPHRFSSRASLPQSTWIRITKQTGMMII